MHSPYFKSRAVLKVFKRLDQEIAFFNKESNISCIRGCSLCCLKPDLEATPLEFLPFAYELWKEGEAFTWLEKLKNTQGPVCVFLKTIISENDEGHCAHYMYRGLTCRLFASGARKNKYGVPEYISCKPIKETQHAAVDKVKALIKDAQVPIFMNYYMQLHAIDADLTRSFYPINEAIKTALEYVLSYYAYRPQKFRKAV